ncbi:MAG: hypothetical protein ACREUT_06060 [Steroidobacteraceae bacterium]
MREALEAAAWYERKRPGLGEDSQHAIDAARAQRVSVSRYFERRCSRRFPWCGCARQMANTAALGRERHNCNPTILVQFSTEKYIWNARSGNVS